MCMVYDVLHVYYINYFPSQQLHSLRIFVIDCLTGVTGVPVLYFPSPIQVILPLLYTIL